MYHLCSKSHQNQSWLEIIPEDILLTIALYLDIDDHLCSFYFLSKMIKRFCDKNLRTLLINHAHSSHLELKSFDINNLLHLCRVINAQYKLGNFSLITNQGQVYLWGYTNWDEGTFDCRPKLIDTLSHERIIQVGNLAFNQFFLTQRGHVYACGHNQYDQLGLNDDLDQLGQELFLDWLTNLKSKPELVTTLSHVKIIQVPMENSYANNTLFLTQTGQVYACGQNQYGQLGLGDTIKRKKPELIMALSHLKIIQVITKTNHSLFLTETGQVYACGGYHKQTITVKPVLLEDLSHLKIIHIVSGFRQIMFLTHTGQVYAWKTSTEVLINSYEVFGNQLYKLEQSLITTLIDTVVIQISTGYDHNLFLTKTGQVYAYGKNDHGELGLGHCIDQNEPVLIESIAHLAIIKIHATYNCSMFLTQQGQIYACGREVNLGLKGVRNILLPKLMNHLDITS